MTTFDDIRDALNDLEAAELTTIAALTAQIADLQEKLDACMDVPTPEPPPSTAAVLGFAGPDPTGKAKAVRVYLNPGEAFPKPQTGITHIVTYKGTDHTNRAQQAKAYGKPVYFGWTHEPENGANNIGANVYVAGWKEFDAAVKAAGATNVQRIWCLMSASFNTAAAASYYPGDAFVDVVAADGYDWCGCRDAANKGKASPTGSHRSFGQIFDNVVRFAKLHNKSVAMLEFGTPQEKSGSEVGREAWITAAVRFINSKPQGVPVVAATYFQHGTADGFRCDWTLKGASLAAYEAAL